MGGSRNSGSADVVTLGCALAVRMRSLYYPLAQLAQLARQGWPRGSDTVGAGAWRAGCKSEAALRVEALLEAKGGRLVGVL